MPHPKLSPSRPRLKSRDTSHRTIRSSSATCAIPELNSMLPAVSTPTTHEMVQWFGRAGFCHVHWTLRFTGHSPCFKSSGSGPSTTKCTYRTLRFASGTLDTATRRGSHCTSVTRLWYPSFCPASKNIDCNYETSRRRTTFWTNI